MIVASTATVRRARDQITALFDRNNTAVFPPPGIQRTDSWFAITQTPEEAPACLYLGLAAQGRGPKLVDLRALVSFMAAAAALYREAGGDMENNPADPYMTALCYFNALRELGSARRIVEDEVASRLKTYGDARRRIRPEDEKPFADREIGEPLELTARFERRRPPDSTKPDTFH